MSIGTLDDGYVVASETCAFDTIGAAFLRDVRPGELVCVDEDGLTSHQVVEGNQKIDVFEFVYFARPDSIIMGQRVNSVRQNFGLEMAKEFCVKADVVIPVPDSSIPAALGYSRASGIPFDVGIIKNRYIHRTFIQPTAGLRKRDVKMKLNPILESVAGKRVVLVDDSVVRGTTMRQVVQIVHDAGARQVHLIISSPPVLYPDFYGIDTPDQRDLIAAHMSLEEMRAYLHADTLNFLSIDGMVRATGLQRDQLSLSCFDGVYPIAIGRRREAVTGGGSLVMGGMGAPWPNGPEREAAERVDGLGARAWARRYLRCSPPGEGTTAEALIRACLEGEIDCEVGLVISSSESAGVLGRVDRINRSTALGRHGLHGTPRAICRPGREAPPW